MAALVLDASATAGFFFADEGGAGALALLSRVELDGAVAPAIWPLECVNILRQGERRGRLTADEASAAVSLLRRLPVRIEPASTARSAGPVLELARRHGLTAYDAAYLELAKRLGLPLATRDAALARAAATEAVAVLPA